MHFLIIQLFKQEYRDDLILALTACGITKASIFEGENLDKVLQMDIPLFTGLIKPAEMKQRYAMMITAVAEKESAGKIVQLLKDADIDIQREDIMRIVMLPVEMVVDNETDWRAGGKK
jgi:hypothetical protein